MVMKSGTIRILNGTMKDAEVSINDKETLYIGKDARTSNIVLGEDYPYVSRTHCSITYDGEQDVFFIVDLSSNGVFVNRTRLEYGMRTAVSRNSEIALANEQCRISLEVNETVDIAQENPPVQSDAYEESQLESCLEEEDVIHKKKNYFWYIGVAIIGFIIILVAVAGISQQRIYLWEGPEDENVSETENLIPSDIKKTVMIYFVGSDLESEYGAASLDIMEILDSDVNMENVNVLIYTGGAASWELPNISSMRNNIYILEDNELVRVKFYNSLNMGDSNTLSQFLEYGLTNYPADKYGLILWNHGAGPMMGYGHDELSGDILELSEITTALSAAGFGGDKKLEFLGFDACLMCSVETAWSVKDYAEYLIASQEMEPGMGWDYSFLNKLNYYDTGDQIGKEIIDAYFESYEQVALVDSTLQMDLTMSCLDLSCMEDVETSIDNLFLKVEQGIDSGNFPKVSRCRGNTKTFGLYTDDFSYDLVDLYHLVELLEADYEKEAKVLHSDLEKLVSYSRSNVQYANGVSIYHPYENMDVMNEWLEKYKTFQFAQGYTEYISNFSNQLQGMEYSMGSLLDNEIKTNKEKDKDVFTMQLTKEQAEHYARAQYYVLKKIENDEYLFMFSGSDVTLDDSGMLCATYDNKAVFIVNETSGEVSDFPITMYQINDIGSDMKYSASSIMYDQSSEDVEEWEVVAAEWQIKIEDGEPKLLNIYPINEEEIGIPSKQSLDYHDYTSVHFVGFSRYLKRESNGSLLPYFEWESTGVGYGHEIVVEDGFHFECRNIEESSDYYVMFVVEDITGKQYASELKELKQ